jgi:hypothetical protein
MYLIKCKPTYTQNQIKQKRRKRERKQMYNKKTKKSLKNNQVLSQKRQIRT